MGILNVENFANANIAFRSGYEDLATTLPGEYKLFTESIPSDALVTEIDFPTDTGTLREWVGPLIFNHLRANTQSIGLKKWEKSLVMKAERIDLDPSGITQRAIDLWFSTQNGFDNKIATDALISNSGAGPTGYDAVPLFSTAHPYGPVGTTTQSNKTTSALSVTTFNAAMVALASLRKENGDTIGARGTVLMVGPKLMQLAKEIVEAELRVIAVDNAGAETGTRIAGAASTNVFNGMVTLVINPDLVGAADDYWYVFDASTGFRPIVLVTQKDWYTTVLDKETDPNMFHRDEWLATIRAWKTPAAGAWFRAYAGIL